MVGISVALAVIREALVRYEDEYFGAGDVHLEFIMALEGSLLISVDGSTFRLTVEKEPPKNVSEKDIPHSL